MKTTLLALFVFVAILVCCKSKPTNEQVIASESAGTYYIFSGDSAKKDTVVIEPNQFASATSVHADSAYILNKQDSLNAVLASKVDEYKRLIKKQDVMIKRAVYRINRAKGKLDSLGKSIEQEVRGDSL